VCVIEHTRLVTPSLPRLTRGMINLRCSAPGSNSRWRPKTNISLPDKRRALRLFLYLRLAGHTPTLRASSYFELAAILSKEYDALPPEVRHSSRLLGRKVIREAGLGAAYLLTRDEMPFRPQLSPRPKCPTCRVKRPNKPKSIWPTKEDVEAFCSCFRQFAPYLCPAGNGWHVARRKRVSR
jgi:hypothetical protein